MYFWIAPLEFFLYSQRLTGSGTHLQKEIHLFQQPFMLKNILGATGDQTDDPPPPVKELPI